MKEGTKLALVGMLSMFFVVSIFNEAFHLPVSFLYLLLSLLAGGLALLISCPLLNFLTIKCNFITFLLMGTLLLTGVIYLLNLVMVDFNVNEFVFSGIAFGNIKISEFEVIPIISISIASLLTSFITAIYKELDRK